MIRETSDFFDSTTPTIPMTRPFVGEEEAQAAANAVRSGWLSQGPRVAEFERIVAERVGVTHAIAVNSCTAALHLALICMGVRAGDEVIMPSFTFVATANAVVHAGARPIFVDIDARTYNLNPLLIEEAITNRTKAILPVDQLGLPAALAPIQGIAARRNLKVLEDAACALGAVYRGKPIGAISPLTCFSFHPRKSVTTGEGGMLLTNDDRIAERSQVLRSHGASSSDFTRHHGGVESYNELGFNYRMTDIQAAIG
ncbi:MAG: DegT/DnrJ/EryC1/StrS family aminotransferase, partial [Ktedonobacterales bacterium]